MTSDIETEVLELHEMNVALLDLLVVIGQRFLKYTHDYNMQIEGINSLALLIDKAGSIMEEIGAPYHKNPIIPDGFIHPNSSDDNSTEPSQRCCKVFVG